MSGWTIERHGRSYGYADDAALVRAIQDGLVDGSDSLSGAALPDVITVAEHPVFKHQLIDDEVMNDKGAEAINVDLTPMIDVTFLLLIFFMTTTLVVMFKSLDAPGGQSQQRPGSTRRLPTRSEVEARALFIHVDAVGACRIGLAKVVGRESIRKALVETMAREGKRTVVIEADDKTRHGDIVQVIDAANLAKVDKILFAKPVQPGTGGRR